MESQAGGELYVQLHLLGDGRNIIREGKTARYGMRLYDKRTLIEELHKIRSMEWIPNARSGNDGGVGNTLEDLLGLTENNLPLANAGEWELKAQRATTNSLLTLCHLEPSPQALKFVPNILLPLYGWRHKKAGEIHPAGEMSFRQTISGQGRSDRGFQVTVDNDERKLVVSFSSESVDQRHIAWLAEVAERVGLGELNPQPYWGFDDLRNKIGVKLKNCCYVKAEVRKQGQAEYYRYSQIYLLSGFSMERLIDGIVQGIVFVDFDARTGHNHGTKFRVRSQHMPNLYSHVEIVE